MHFFFFYDFILEGKLCLTIVLTDGASLVAQKVKILPAVQETWIQSLGWEDPPGEVNGNPPQYSCLKNSKDRKAWRATVCGVTELDTTERPTLALFIFMAFYDLHPNVYVR